MIGTESSLRRALRGLRATRSAAGRSRGGADILQPPLAETQIPLATAAPRRASKNPPFCPDIGQSAAGKSDLRQTAFVSTRLCPVTIASKPPRFAAPGCRVRRRSFSWPARVRRGESILFKAENFVNLWFSKWLIAFRFRTSRRSTFHNRQDSSSRIHAVFVDGLWCGSSLAVRASASVCHGAPTAPSASGRRRAVVSAIDSVRGPQTNRARP